MTKKKTKTKTKTIYKKEEVEYGATQYKDYIDSFKAGQTFKLIFALKNSINYIPVHCSCSWHSRYYHFCIYNAIAWVLKTGQIEKKTQKF